MATFKNLTFVDYRDQYFQQMTHTLVDVRTRSEYIQGHVPGAVNIPLDQLQGRTDEIASDRPVVVICATGNRSQTGAKIFKQAGYSEVYNLQGGTMVWMMNGKSLEY
jgi:phage shock protein E